MVVYKNLIFIPISTDNQSSLVCRCIERDKEESLDIFLSFKFTPEPIQLRFCRSAKLLVKAYRAGWKDIELEKRIITIQRLWRKQHIGIRNPFEGPTLNEVSSRKGGYFGYRLSLYSLMWNRKYRWRLYKDILLNANGFDWGSCTWQAYIDFLKEENDEMDLPHQINK